MSSTPPSAPFSIELRLGALRRAVEEGAAAVPATALRAKPALGELLPVDDLRLI